jgi:hypothetical protein
MVRAGEALSNAECPLREVGVTERAEHRLDHERHPFGLVGDLAPREAQGPVSRHSEELIPAAVVLESTSRPMDRTVVGLRVKTP